MAHLHASTRAAALAQPLGSTLRRMASGGRRPAATAAPAAHRSFSFLQQPPPPQPPQPPHPVLRASSPLSPPLPPFFASPPPSAWQSIDGDHMLSPRLRINPSTIGDSSTVIRDLVDREGWLPTADILEGLLNHKAPPAPGGGVGDEVGDPAQGPTPPAPVLAIKRTFQPSTIRKKRKHGFLVRLRDEEGRKTIHRRRLKGRSRLSM